MILSVETSTRAFSVSLFEGIEIANMELKYDVTHSRNIVSAVEFLLKSINKSINDVDEIYAGCGPGSFSGIRIGLSFVNTIYQSTGIPLLGIPSLDLLAFEGGKWYNPAVSFIRSRRDEVYTAFYNSGKRITEYLALTKRDFLVFIKENNPLYLISSEEDYRSIAGEDECLALERVITYPKARNACLLARECGLKSEKRYLKPLYVRGIY